LTLGKPVAHPHIGTRDPPAIPSRILRLKRATCPWTKPSRGATLRRQSDIARVKKINRIKDITSFRHDHHSAIKAK
jgi:hypothetical protein